MSEVHLSGLNLNLLVHLDALLELRNVTRAAHRAGVTQSAMSHSLAKLRSQFSDELLVRRGRSNDLTTGAEALRQPLRRMLLDLQKLVQHRGKLDPRTIERTFAIACPDFLSVLVVPRVIEVVARQAPGVCLDIVPADRRRYAEMLASGQLDLALGGVLFAGEGIVRTTLYRECFVGLVRRAHPLLKKRITLERYAAAPHALISIGESSGPTWVDDQLRLHGLSRRVTVRTRSFLAAPMLVADSDLVLTGPRRLCQHMARSYALKLFELPIELPEYSEEVLWHERFADDPAHRWLRNIFQEQAEPI
jgi:DNA-binding transcriptional LysR family regulator